MKRTHIIGIVIIALAIAAILSTVSDSGTYATFGVASEHPGKEYHVVGKLVKTKEQIYNPAENPNLFSFYLADNEGKEMKVMLNAAKPQDFEKSEQIVIIGKMKDSEFIASNVLLKCPSKYNNGEGGVKDIKPGT